MCVCALILSGAVAKIYFYKNMHEFTNPFMILTILRLSHKAHECIQNFINSIMYTQECMMKRYKSVSSCTPGILYEMTNCNHGE